MANIIVSNILIMLERQDKTQKSLMDYIGVDKNVFSNWKNGTSASYVKYLPQIAKFLNVSVDWLIGSDEDNEVTIVDNIFNIMAQKGYMQKDLVNHLGINKAIVSTWKSGTSKSYEKYLPQIAVFLDVPLECLTGSVIDDFTIVNNIINMLERMHYTQQDLADYLGVYKSTITEWKRGKTTSFHKYISEIAEFLNVSVDYLTKCDVEMQPVCNLVQQSVPQFAISDKERDLIKLFRKLNGCGQKKVISYIADISSRTANLKPVDGVVQK